MPATDKDTFQPCTRSVEMIDLSTNEIGDPITHCQYAQVVMSIHNFDAHYSLSPPCVIFVATAVIESEAPVVASFFEKSLCKSLLCRLPVHEIGTIQVLLLQ